MPGLVHKYDGEFVIENISDLKENYEEFTNVKWDIEIGNYYATPSNLTINVGDTVTWTNAGGYYHLLTGWAGQDSTYTNWYPIDPYGPILFGSGYAAAVSYTFGAEGSFDYYCALHPASWDGTITVAGLGTKKVIKSVDSTGIIPISRVVPGPSSLRRRSSAYTPSKGGNPLDMGK